MATFISENTDEPFPIVCRFCQEDLGRGGEIEGWSGKRVTAVRLRGQWEGGDQDGLPVWVPVCWLHDHKWNESDLYPDGRLDPKYQMPAFTLDTWWVVIEREDPFKDLYIGPYPSSEAGELAANESLLVEGELQDRKAGGGVDCYVIKVGSGVDEGTCDESLHSLQRQALASDSAIDMALIHLDDPHYTGEEES